MKSIIHYLTPFLLSFLLVNGCDKPEELTPEAKADIVRIIPSPPPLPEEERWSYISSIPRPIREAEILIAYSLNPTYGDSEADTMYGWEIRGKTIVPPEQADDLADTFEIAFREGEEREIGAGCFNPRHALRCYDGLSITDFIICFECGGFQIYRNGARVSRYLISSRAEGLFNEVLGLERDAEQHPEFRPEDFPVEESEPEGPPL